MGNSITYIKTDCISAEKFILKTLLSGKNSFKCSDECETKNIKICLDENLSEYDIRYQLKAIICKEIEFAYNGKRDITFINLSPSINPQENDFYKFNFTMFDCTAPLHCAAPFIILLSRASKSMIEEIKEWLDKSGFELRTYDYTVSELSEFCITGNVSKLKLQEKLLN